MFGRSPATVVLVTGCSSGIGKAICDQLAMGGKTVYGGSRTPCTSSLWTHLVLDVTEQGSVDAAVADVLRRGSRLDGLVACAGVGLAGSLEDTDDDEAKRNFDTNFFGTARVVRAVLPTMRKQSSGKIVVIGSIGGLIGLPFVPYYSASKFALDGLIEALRGEITPFGIQATVVHPGDLNTAFGANRIIGRNVGAVSAYWRRFQDTLQFYAAQEDNAPSPLTLARKVEKLLSQRSLPARVIVGTPLEKLGVSSKRYLPGRSFEYLLRKAYAPK
jgi:NAD(P)-dependent dehydrogenase (short-subunit alcohol dehydrogenase family)